MKHLKSILTILILAAAVAGVTDYALAQKGKEPITLCKQCKKQHVKGYNSICGDCSYKNKKAAEEKSKREAEKRTQKETMKREIEVKEAERRDAERRRAEQERIENEKKEQERKETERLESEKKAKEDAEKAVNERIEQERNRIINDYINSMVYVEGGTFKMGARGRHEDEEPIHNVTLSSYYIGRTEVTQELWETVMGNNPSSFKGAKRPVENVSWFDCQKFLIKLNLMTGKVFRLPTEAEWEYAARGGNKSQDYMYSGSNKLKDVASEGDSTSFVSSKRANELGLYDMTGNVWEWCSDWYGQYTCSSPINPQGPLNGSKRVGRGSSYFNVVACLGTFVSTRGKWEPEFRSDLLGFRFVMQEDQKLQNDDNVTVENNIYSETLLKKAQSGDVDAQNSLGMCYYLNHGVPQDYTQAVYWLKKAAEQGNCNAQNNLGHCYESGNGVPQDSIEALRWYRKSAECGDANGQYSLGECYYYGYGVTLDYSMAVYWYRKSAEQGNPSAQNVLGLCYGHGRGVDLDYNLAILWIRKSAEQGFAMGQNNLGVCYENGFGVKKNRKQAILWYRKAAWQGNFSAKEALIRLDNTW